MKNTLIIALLTVPLLYSCKKNTIETKQALYQRADFSQIDIGKMHNDVVKMLFRSIAPRPNARVSNPAEEIFNPEEALKSLGLDFSPLGITTAEFYARVNYTNQELSSYGYDLNNYPVQSNPTVVNYVNEIIANIEAANTLEEINSAMDALDQKANAELTDQNLDIVIGTTRIARSSAKLWAPASIGGEDLLSQYPALYEQYPVAKVNRWEKAVYGDVSASAAYFQTLGIGSVLGWAPGTNAIILGGWAISAGIGSAYGALGL